MRIITRVLSLLLLGGIAFGLAACQEFANVPPSDIAMMLTPTGYDGKIYTPGQVDIGDLDTTKRGNSLVLIQRSGVEVKEQFLRGNNDGEDHRCLVGPNKEAMSLDIRLVLALPNYETPEGKKDLLRLFLLGNPVATKESARILRLTADSIYVQQAQLQVRGKIRQICAQYANFDAAFAAFGDDGENGFSRKIEKAVAQALTDNQVPLRLVNAVVSNMKPDQTVTDAISAKQAAEKRVQAIQVITNFLDQDPTGSRKLVYKAQVVQEIIKAADDKGRSVIYMMDLQTAPGTVIPTPQR